MLHTLCFKAINEAYPVSRHMGNYLSYLYTYKNFIVYKNKRNDNI